MKKILVALIGLILIFLLTSCACESQHIDVNVSNSENISSNNFGSFINIDGNLVYDSATRIVYVKSYTYNNNYTYTPYYAPNGLPYRYDPITNTLKEIK